MQRDSVKIRPEILQAVDTIAKQNGVEIEHEGMDGGEAKRWAPFKELCDSATNLELRSLTNYPNPAVRCYSFLALALRNDTALFSILLAHLSDTAQVSVQNYDVGFNQITEDYLIDVVTPESVDLKAYKLNMYQRQTLDSILIYNKQVSLYAKERLLSELKPNLKYYDRIREMALNEDNAVAVLTLSRYRKKSDINIINSYLNGHNPDYYVVYAVREFPDNKFYPGLVRLFEKEWKQKLYDYQLWRIIYQALAQYPNPKTISLFERTTKTKDDFRYQTLGADLVIAINKYPNDQFTTIRKKIKLDKYHQDDVDEGMKYDNY